MSKKPSFTEACAMYPHRFTMQHVPAWAREPMARTVSGEPAKYYAPHYRTDREWYDNTEFTGPMITRGHCYSTNQTWPLGESLDAPYDVLMRP